MAEKIIDVSVKEPVTIFALTRKEAADIIGLLAAQLADTALPGNLAGGCPQFWANGKYGTHELISLVVK